MPEFNLRDAVLKVTKIKQPSDPSYQWGSLSLLVTLDLSKTSRSYLRRHLAARNELTNGTKKQLVERLSNSIQEERLRGVAYREALGEKHCHLADLEERGAVYVVGSNHRGQLGLGDLEHRDSWTVIRSMSGAGVVSVSSGYDASFAVTQNHSVYTWGGGVVGIHQRLGGGAHISASGTATATNTAARKRGSGNTDPAEYKPRILDALNGEEIVMTTAGASHYCALSNGGDCFVWGHGKRGALGLGHFQNRTQPELMNGFKKTDVIARVASGENHMMALTDEGRVYSWGHASSGRLGIGLAERVGARKDRKKYFPAPSLVDFSSGLSRTESVTRIACGVEHTIATTSNGVYSWGSGDGGRLGLGDDFSDRCVPEQIRCLDGWNIVDISAGTWHSACIVLVPPLKDTGWVYTWGSGFHGQLGQGNDITLSSKPSLVSDLCSDRISVKTIVCGSHHNAAITGDGKIYTWGSNANRCLGHEIDDNNAPFTPHPGCCGGFGSMVNRIGRGLARSVACGKEFTIVATFPYADPNNKEANVITDPERVSFEEEIPQRDEQRYQNNADHQTKNDTPTKNDEVMLLKIRRLCTLDTNCPGYRVHVLKPNVCRECGQSNASHTIIEDESGTIDKNLT